MPTNFWMWFVAGLIPMVIGAIWYNPKVFGTAWMKTNNFTPEYAAGGNMAVIFGLSYVFSVFIAMALSGVVIHQTGMFSTMAPEVMTDQATMAQFNELMSQYGDRGRTFGHGAFHGIFFAILVALPIIGIIALFERRSAKYIMIHFGYWLICLILMGGLLCATLKFPTLSL